MNKRRFILWIAVICLLATLLPATALAATDGWSQNADGSWSYYQNGAWVVDRTVYISGKYYCFDAAGKMYENQWHKDDGGNWYYFGSDGARYEEGVYQFDTGVYYGFNWNAQMYTDTTFSASDANGDWREYRAKADGTLYCGEWYDAGNGDWQYYAEDAALCENAVVKIGGAYYGFNSGYMYKDTTFGLYDANGNWVEYRAKADGKLYCGEWYDVGNGDWQYYAEDAALCEYEVVKIGDAYYGFGYNGYMFKDTTFSMYDANGDWREYRAKADGTLYRNEWYENEWGNRRYYGADCAAAEDFILLDGIWYFFRNGYVVNDALVTAKDGKYYYIYNEGMSYMNVPAEGWFQIDGEYYYHKGNGQLCENEVMKIKGAYYGFNWNGRMYTDQTFSFGQWDSAQDRYVYKYYRAKADGTLYVNTWYETEGGSWYYYGAGGAGYSDFAQVNGTWYFFDCARMITDKLVYSELYGKYYVISESGTSSTVVPNNGWVSAGDDYYYIQDGEMLSGGVHKIGSVYYYFDWDGQMLDNGSIGTGRYNEEQDRYEHLYYRAKKGGALYVNQWYQDGSNWYYYGAEGAGRSDFVQVNGTWYFFEDARMVTDRLVYSDLYGKYYVISKDGKSSTEISKDGWYQTSKYYYYVQNGEMCRHGIYKIAGLYYGFDYDGRMYENTSFGMYNEELGRGVYYRAKKGGALYVNTWYETEWGNWYYYGAEGKGANDFVAINGTWYFFEDARMVTNQLVYSELYDGYYVISGDGKTSRPITQDGWVSVGSIYYYIKDGRMCQEEICQIGGKYYAFDYDGWMVKDGSYGIYSEELDRYVQVRAKEDGTLYVNQWYETEWGDWYYYGAGGIAPQGYTELDGAWYYFTDSGWMYASSCANVDGKYYAFGENGKRVTAQGKQDIGDCYVYVKADGTVVNDDWVKIDGKWHYFTPAMYANTLTQIEGKLYAIDNAGVCVQVTGNGIYDIGLDGKVYLQNGVVSKGWKKVGGSWYYFGESGMYRNDVYKIDDVKYVFDQNGKMFTGGWLLMGVDYYYKDISERWYVYADAAGKAATGMKTIGGKQYIFSDWGYLYTDTSIEVDGTTYVVDKDGVVVGKADSNGWKQLDGKYYYVRNGELVREEIIKIGGKLYAFDYDGVMITNQTYWVSGEGRVLAGADGVLKTGWCQHNNYWYYAEANGHLVEGRKTIGGKTYIFSMAMQTGTFMWDGKIVTTDASGAIVSEKDPADGWSYVGGTVYYYKNGQPYDGWVGDYLITDGVMAINGSYYWEGDYYAINSYGKYVKSGWHRFDRGEGRYSSYVYAKAGGKLCCNEWLVLNGKWYYFDDIYMCRGIYVIDGEQCKFDANGVYQGKVSLSAGDGWKKAGGSWYYIHAGEPVTYLNWIDGKRYVFDWDGRMLCGGFVDMDGAWIYTNDDGTIPNYTGWKEISGEWIYFNSSNLPVMGWFQDNGKTYYADSMIVDGELVIGIVTGYHYVSGQLYYFNGDGVCQGTKGVQNGWFKAGSEWYYFRNGAPVTGYQVIDGKGYYFNAFMVTNVIMNDRYFGSNGVQRTTTGWYKTDAGWIYVKADGRLVNGVQKIGGKEYYFRNNIMIR